MEMDAIDEAFLELEEAHDCLLFPPDPDFSNVCSCDECRLKIEKLKEFQKEMMAKQILVSEHSAQANIKEDLCLSIFTGAQFTKMMLDFFKKKLIAVSRDSRVVVKLTQSSSAAMEDVNEQIAQRLREVRLLGKKGEEIQVPDDDDHDNVDISEIIDTGRYYYNKTKAKCKADALFQDMENAENYWEMAKKEAEAPKLEKDIDGKKYPVLYSLILLEKLDKKDAEAYKLEKQIEFVNKLPIKELQYEIEEIISKIFPREPRWMMIDKATECIYGTCYTCIRKRKEFWQKSPNPNGHSVLKETLDSLIEEVNLFNEQWNKEFAHVFSPRDRSNPKRQQVG